MNDDEEYMSQLKKLLLKTLKKKNTTFTQYENGEVVIRKTKILETVYKWDRESKKLIKKLTKIY